MSFCQLCRYETFLVKSNIHHENKNVLLSFYIPRSGLIFSIAMTSPSLSSFLLILFLAHGITDSLDSDSLELSSSPKLMWSFRIELISSSSSLFDLSTELSEKRLHFVFRLFSTESIITSIFIKFIVFSFTEILFNRIAYIMG